MEFLKQNGQQENIEAKILPAWLRIDPFEWGSGKWNQTWFWLLAPAFMNLEILAIVSSGFSS